MTAIGQTLREARMARNVSLEQAAQETRISLRFLEALEEEDFKVLPAPVYVRGFLRSYANYLGVEPQQLVDELQSFEDGAARPSRSADPFQPSRGVHPLPTSVIVEGGEQYADDAPYAEGAYQGQGWDDEETAGWDERETSYPGQNLPRRGSSVRGVLNERTADPSGITRVAMIVAGGAVVVVVVLVALLLLGGGGSDPAVAPLATETPTATLAAGTVIEVGSPTVAGTAAGGGDATQTPEGTGTPDTTATATAAAPTATAATTGGNATTVPPQTATPTATATATPVPQATATFAPIPTATPTVIPHPYGFNECIQTNNECPADSMVVCAPNGFFVDVLSVPPSSNWPAEWPQYQFTTVSAAKTVCQ